MIKLLSQTSPCKLSCVKDSPSRTAKFSDWGARIPEEVDIGAVYVRTLGFGKGMRSMMVVRDRRFTLAPSEMQPCQAGLNIEGS